MSYKPRSLFSMIEEINNSLFLPHIQRPFVWDREQMCRLFDSIMRNYPIQTLLFWRTRDEILVRKFMDGVVPEPVLSDYYDEPKSNKGVPKVLVLDGQQRLQTLYCIFSGSIRELKTNTDLHAYFDATGGKLVDDDGMLYPLRFEEAAPGPTWYRIRDLYGVDQQRNAEDISDALNRTLDAALAEAPDLARDRERRVRRNIGQLVSILREERHFWVEEMDGISNPDLGYDRVLDIFVRVNSGGTKLDAGDLMFAAMKEKSDRIEENVEEIASVLNNNRLSFDKSFVLKCLVVAHGRGAELGAEKFSGTAGKELLAEVEATWERSEAAFHQLRDLIVSELGLFSDKVVRSYSAFIPIFDFLFHNPKPDEHNRQLIKAYYYKSQLFSWFRAHTDSLVNVMHGMVGRDRGGEFPIDEVKEYFGSNAAVALSHQHLLDNRLRHILLNLIYVEQFGTSPFNVQFKGNEPHIDHIYPQSGLRSAFGLYAADINHLGNYRYVGATDNIRKRAERPSSYFAGLKAAGIPIVKHLLLDDVSKDPALLAWDLASYLSFRDRRLEAISQIAANVVNAELNGIALVA